MTLFRITFSNYAHGESLVKTASSLRISSPEIKHHQHPPKVCRHPRRIQACQNARNAAKRGDG